nr:15553_t:CDS:2 [Entrophospora candida]
MSHRKLRNVQQPSPSFPAKTSNQSEKEKKDHIASITQLWTMPRATLLLITPILISTVLQVSPRYVEPVYGNVFSNLYFDNGASTSFIFGILVGVGFLTKIKTCLSTVRDQKITNAIILGIDYCGLIFSFSTLMVKLLFKLSGLLGPYIGPHVTQLGLAYPIMFSLGFLNAIVCARLSREQRLTVIRWMPYVLMHTAIIQTLTYVLYNVYTAGRSCHRLNFAGLLLALIGALFKILNIYGKVNLVEDTAGQRNNIFDNISRSAKLRSLSIILIPQFLVIILAIYNFNFNPHCNPNIIQNLTINGAEYKILARNESITGWINVIETNKPYHMRVMRAGHSLLGGIFLNTFDSVYGSFYFMEAVRLVENRRRNTKERALQIGLGIGVSSKSLQLHKVALDIVELDPVVYEYARKFFGLKRKHNIYIQDGREFINNANSRYYDYVLHDVFTGGSVPSTLFSIEALGQIKRILKHDGVLALNFVGSQKWPHVKSLVLVANTIKAIFPYVRCFREGLQEDGFFQNMVFFASNKPIKFRPTTELDYLNSAMRESMLEQFTNWPVNLDKFSNIKGVITSQQNPLDDLQHLSAFEHWNVMRNLFPLEVWINY